MKAKHYTVQVWYNSGRQHVYREVSGTAREGTTYLRIWQPTGISTIRLSNVEDYHIYNVGESV